MVEPLMVRFGDLLAGTATDYWLLMQSIFDIEEQRMVQMPGPQEFPPSLDLRAKAQTVANDLVRRKLASERPWGVAIVECAVLHSGRRQWVRAREVCFEGGVPATIE